jgi:hypothetical protein
MLTNLITAANEMAFATSIAHVKNSRKTSAHGLTSIVDIPMFLFLSGLS